MTTTFGTQVVGQTEKALNAILDRQLAGSLTEPQWVTLTLTVVGGTADADQLSGRVAGVLKVTDTSARRLITELAGARFLMVGDDGTVEVTDAGRALWTEVRVAVGQITQELWGDLPAEDLETAGRVLNIVLARADALLAEA